MSIFSNFTGGQSRRELNEANARAMAALGQARDQQRRDVTGYGDRAAGELRGGYDDAAGIYRGYRDEAVGHLTPWMQGGEAARDLYARATGVGGQDAQRQVFDQYMGADPFRQHNEDRANNALLRLFASRGNANSGAFAMAAQRANLERGSQDYQSWLGHLQGQAAQGGQFAGQAAGLTANAGGQIGGARLGTAKNMADVYQQTGLQLNDVEGRYGRAAADQSYQHGQNMANTRSLGMNNLLGLGSMLVGGFTQGRNGQSAFGNMGRAMTGQSWS